MSYSLCVCVLATDFSQLVSVPCCLACSVRGEGAQDPSGQELEEKEEGGPPSPCKAECALGAAAPPALSPLHGAAVVRQDSSESGRVQVVLSVV